MSNSLLYHTFGIRSVQYLSTNFLAAKPSFTAQSTQTKLSVRYANLVTSSTTAAQPELSKCCRLESGKSN